MASRYRHGPRGRGHGHQTLEGIWHQPVKLDVGATLAVARERSSDIRTLLKARTGSHKGPCPTSTTSPAPTIHGLGGPIRRIVGEPCLGDRESGERLRGGGPCGRPSGAHHLSSPYSPGIVPRISSFMVLLRSMGYLKCIGPCGRPSDVYTHLPL